MLRVADRPRQKNPSRGMKYRESLPEESGGTTEQNRVLRRGLRCSYQREKLVPPKGCRRLCRQGEATTGHVIAISTQRKAKALKAPLSRGDSDPWGAGRYEDSVLINREVR